MTRLARAGHIAVKGGAIGLALPAVLLVLWEALSRFGVAPPNLLPSPLAVLKSLRDLWLTGELLGHIEITLLRVLLGFLLGTAVATVLGALAACTQSPQPSIPSSPGSNGQSSTATRGW